MKRLFGLILFLAFSGNLFGQTYGLAPPVFQPFVDASGNPSVSGKICTYAAGTTTPQFTFSNSSGTTNTNPIILSAAGTTTIYLNVALSYKFVFLTPGTDNTCNTGSTIRTQDNIATVTPANFTITNNVIPRGTGVANGLTDGCISDTGAAVSTTCGVTVQNITATGTVTGFSATVTRAIPDVAQDVILSSGSPVSTILGSGVTAVAMGGTSATAITTWFEVPPDASVANPLVLRLTFSALVAPGVTNNKVKLTVACTVNGTATAPTAGDTITLANNATPVSYTATVNACAASSYAANDAVMMTISRDITVANNYPNDFNIRTIGVNYKSTQ